MAIPHLKLLIYEVRCIHGILRGLLWRVFRLESVDACSIAYRSCSRTRLRSQVDIADVIPQACLEQLAVRMSEPDTADETVYNTLHASKASSVQKPSQYRGAVV